MVKRLLGPSGGKLMSVGVMLSAFGAINSNTLLGPRVTFAMGRDDVFFRALGRVHVNFRTPAIAIVVQALMTVGLFAGAGLWLRFGPGDQTKSVFDVLTNYVTFSASIFYMLAVLAVIVLRMRHPEWERPYRTWGYPFVPLAYLAFYAWFLYYVYVGQSFEARVGLALIAAGLPVYFAYRQWARRVPENTVDGK
jgi:APA family basic amino acid/polyamine antiporter